MATIPLSVVVPLYNKRETVLRTVECILGQTFSSFELIVVNDGSNDGSPDMISHIQDSRMRIVHQANEGLSEARNRGIQEALGELVAFLDADDYWEPQFLEAMVGLRRLYPQAGLLASGVGRCWMDGRPDELLAVRPSGPNSTALLSYFEGAREGSFVTSSSVCIPRQVLLEVGGFQPKLRLCEDRDTWIRISLRYPTACDSRILSYYFTPHRPAPAASLPAPHLPMAFVQNLIGRLTAGEVQPALLPAVQSYVDSMHRQHCGSLAWGSDISQLRLFLANTRCWTPAGRCFFMLVRLALSVFPLAMARALVIKPRLLWLKLRTALPDPIGKLFSHLRRTESPCRHLPRSPGSG